MLALSACTATGTATGEDHVLAPVIAGDAVYIGREDGGVYAVDRTADDVGRELWRRDTEGGVIHSPAVDDGTVYAGATGGYLYAWDARTGDLRWRYEAGSTLFFSPAVNGDTVYIGSEDGHLHAVAADSGERRWRYALERRLLAWPPLARSKPRYYAAVHDGVVYVAGSHGRVHGVDVATGEQVHELDTGSDTPPAIRDGVLYTGGDGESIAVDLATWSIRWRTEVGHGDIRYPNPGAEAVYFGDDAGDVHAVSVRDGSVLWSFATGGAVHSVPAPHGEFVLVGSHDGNLYGLAKATGHEQWRHVVGEGVGFDGIAATAAISNEIAYFGVADHGLVGVDVNSGETRWRFEPER